MKFFKLDKYLYTFIIIFFLISVCLCFSIETNKEISDRLDSIEKNINGINYEISSIKDTASDTDAKIVDIENTLIDKIDTEIINYMAEVEETTEEVTENTSNNTCVQNDTDGVLTAFKGVNYYGEQKETYYNLPMDGVISIAQSQGIEGEYWVREDGVKMYGNYVIVAANLDVHPRGSLIETSLGTGIVLDTGGFAATNHTQVDIATAW